MIALFEDVIIKTICRILIPFMLLFAIYVIMHGHYSPGGGFQGGVMLGASFILLIIAYGLKEGRWRLTFKSLMRVASLGLLIYSGIGFISLLTGGNYLDYGKLPLSFLPIPKIRAMGILGIEIGVGIGVMGIMIIIFLAIASFDSGEKFEPGEK